MHLGILTQYYPPEMGAPQARLSELAARFKERGHQITILTAHPNYPTGRIFPNYGGFISKESLGGCDVIRTLIYPTQKLGLLPRLANYFSFVLSSMSVGAVSLPKLDFLLTESPPLFLGISGYVLSRFKQCRWIFNVSDLWPETAVRLGMVRRGLGLSASWKLESFCYRKAWMVSGQSREILQNIGQRFPSVRQYHLSNGVDTRLFDPSLRSQDLRLRLGAGNGCLAVYAGLHGAAQGLDQVLDAATLFRDLPDLVILFVGDGPEKRNLQERAKQLSLNNVSFLDPFPRQEMPALIASADIALVPLKSYLPGAVPSKLYEAMGSGVSVVLAAQGEAADIVRAHHCGVVVAPGDSKALAGELRRLASNAGERGLLGRNGREAAIHSFDRQEIAARFIDYLESELGK